MPGSAPEPLPHGPLARPQYTGAAATRSARVTQDVPRSSLLESARSERGHRRADLLRGKSLRGFSPAASGSSRASLYVWCEALQVTAPPTADTSLASRYSVTRPLAAQAPDRAEPCQPHRCAQSMSQAAATSRPRPAKIDSPAETGPLTPDLRPRPPLARTFVPVSQRHATGPSAGTRCAASAAATLDVPWLPYCGRSPGSPGLHRTSVRDFSETSRLA